MVLLYTTVGSHDDARTLAKVIIHARLCACVNIFHSHTALYMNNQTNLIAEEPEIAMLFKIPEDCYQSAYECIKTHHPYDVPALMSWPAEVNKGYGIWAYKQTQVFM
jgi:periplasmic divalent cation tolerance protein